MALNLGTLPIDNVKLGGLQVSSIYQGPNKVWPTTFSSLILSRGCIGYWKLDELLDTDPAIDRSSLGNSLAAVSAPLVQQAAIMNENPSTGFDGNFQMGYSSIIDNAEWHNANIHTVTWWCYSDSPTVNNAYVAAWGDQDANDYAWRVLERTLDSVRSSTRANSVNNHHTTAAGTFTNDVIQFVTVSMNRNDNTITFWVNGAFVTTMAMTPWSGLPTSPNAFMNIGRRKEATSTNGWKGRISNLAVLDYQPTDAEVLAFYNAGKL